MKKLIVALTVGLTLSSAFSAAPKLTPEEIAKRKAEIAAMTPEQRAQRRAQIKARMEARNGGTVVDRTRQKGRILIVVDQKDISPADIKLAVKPIVNLLHVAIDVEEKPAPDVAKVKDFLWDNKANVVIGVTSKPGAPSLLVAPEDRWAQINLEALKGGDVKMRTQKEVSRAIAFLCGAASTSYVQTLVSPITSMADLDGVDGFELPIDSLRTMEPYFKGIGITPWREAYYRVACKEGWAPQPTNDIQKAIWNEVHHIPENPIKIEFNEKRDAGK